MPRFLGWEFDWTLSGVLLLFWRIITLKKLTTEEKMMTVLRGKFRGCLVGGLIGDCFGVKFETAEMPQRLPSKRVLDFFDSFENHKRNFILNYTDDTAMARALAESLIECKTLDMDNLAKRFTKLYFEQPYRGYGFHVREVFHKLKKNGYSDPLKPAKEQFEGRGSYGNGAPMRIGPAALLKYNNKEEMIEIARSQSLITHAHHNGYNGAILLSLAIQEALTISPSDTVNKVEFVEKLYKEMSEIESNFQNPEERDYCNQLNRMKSLLQREDVPSIDEAVVELGNNVTALRSVPIAIYSFLVCQTPITEFMMENTFERIIKYAICVGGDTDTIACMAGYIAGAHLGINAIPKYLQTYSEDCNEIIRLADKLYEIANPD